MQELGIIPPEPELISPPSDDEGKGGLTKSPINGAGSENQAKIEFGENKDSSNKLLSKEEYIEELKKQHKKEESLPFEIIPESEVVNPFEEKKINEQAEKEKKEEELKATLKTILSKIPSDQSELFHYKLNWSLLATSGLIEKKVKPWLASKSVEYLGQNEPIFVNEILKKLANNVNGFDMMKKAAKVIDDEAEEFTVKLWRMLIFETSKLEVIN